MNPVLVVLAALLVLLLAYALVVLLPVLVGKLFLRWSRVRCGYVLKESFSAILGSLVVSLILTGLILLIGFIFKQKWAFSGGLLFVYLFWVSIKTVRETIRSSKGM